METGVASRNVSGYYRANLKHFFDTELSFKTAYLSSNCYVSPSVLSAPDLKALTTPPVSQLSASLRSSEEAVRTARNGDLQYLL